MSALEQDMPPRRDIAPKPNHAFGVDPHRREFYSLRQSRYDALAHDIDRAAGEAARAGGKLRLLEIGCGTGVLLRYLEVRPNFAAIEISGTELSDKLHFYGRELYHDFFIGDLMAGYPQIATDSYDMVICEQVLEHLPRLDGAIATLERVLKPGGILIVGVPIFPPPLHLMRRHVVPRLDRIFPPKNSRGHLQHFSRGSFLAEMRRHSRLEFVAARGFRIISGGMLRPLENHRWWWRANRRLGAWLPGACIEIQAILTKPRQRV
jgi:SAM-dependent methyltransferase